MDSRCSRSCQSSWRNDLLLSPLCHNNECIPPHVAEGDALSLRSMQVPFDGCHRVLPLRKAFSICGRGCLHIQGGHQDRSVARRGRRLLRGGLDTRKGCSTVPRPGCGEKGTRLGCICGIDYAGYRVNRREIHYRDAH
jgi:hypothetical protein